MSQKLRILSPIFAYAPVLSALSARILRVGNTEIFQSKLQLNAYCPALSHVQNP